MKIDEKQTVNNDIILSVKNLTVDYKTDEGSVQAVRDISFQLERSKTVGLVGETGAGKTTIALAIMRLLPVPPAVVRKGEVILEGENIIKRAEKKMRDIRGNKISMIFQDPMTALDPTISVGEQIREVISIHEKINKREERIKAEEALEMVGIPRERYDEYPHQFSGGMKQRVVIAIALACHPDLLIADEPTTALDVTIQAQILQLMKNLQKKNGTSNIMITHDLGVIAEMCDSVAIVYAGQIVESGSTRQIFLNMAHPYTKGLFDALPDINNAKEKRLKPIKGLMPDPTDLPIGCAFAPRCPYATSKCSNGAIEMMNIGDGHFVRCLKPLMKEEGANV